MYVFHGDLQHSKACSTEGPDRVDGREEVRTAAANAMSGMQWHNKLAERVSRLPFSIDAMKWQRPSHGVLCDVHLRIDREASERNHPASVLYRQRQAHAYAGEGAPGRY
jgi:hypothetical protein